jgi:hypothetical protein
MSALTVTLGADITGMKRSLGGAMGIVSSFAKRISGAFSLKGGRSPRVIIAIHER